MLNIPWITNIVISGIFFSSGISLNLKSIGQAFDNCKVLVLTLIVMNVITNQINWLFVYTGLPFNAKLSLVLFMSMPTTINSGLVIVSSVGGNSALGLGTIILGHLSSVFTIPFFVQLYFNIL
mmetsp:Transcript_17686/g.38936  ORF Transcript_17686/g.38936 Transcript_17686/m.38936 type:complete len:123 (+) Transcript_17686:104-472(+)